MLANEGNSSAISLVEVPCPISVKEAGSMPKPVLILTFVRKVHSGNVR